MKTIKQLLKQLLYSQNRDSNVSEEIINPNVSQLNSNQNEAETNEISRNPGLDPAPAAQAHEDAAQDDQSAGGSGRAGNRVSPVEPEASLEERLYTKKDLEEAFQKGVVEGCNRKIESLFFREDKDEVPAFRGSLSSDSPASDIFSLARKA